MTCRKSLFTIAGMTYDDLIKYYDGSPAKAAAARGLDRQLLYSWKIRGAIPIDQQIEYEVVSKGGLRADLPKQIRRQVA